MKADQGSGHRGSYRKTLMGPPQRAEKGSRDWGEAWDEASQGEEGVCIQASSLKRLACLCREEDGCGCSWSWGLAQARLGRAQPNRAAAESRDSREAMSLAARGPDGLGPSGGRSQA